MIVVGIEDDKIALFAYFDASNPVGSLKGGSSVQGQGGDGFFDAHFHIDAGQSNGQRDRTGETKAVKGNRVATTPASAIARMPASEACRR